LDHYDEIKQEDGLDVPQDYRRMCADSLFSYFGDKQYEEMNEAQRIELMRERTLSGKLVYLNYIEWFTPIEGAGMVDGMVPFAGDGSGDQYCWYVPWTGEDGRVPIVYFDHEMWTIKGLAPDYPSWLFRTILEEYTHLDCDTFKPDEIERLVAAYMKMVSPYLPGDLISILKEEGKRPLRQVGEERGLLTEEECEALLKGQMEFKYLDVTQEVKPNY
jgi:hypothetical protein